MSDFFVLFLMFDFLYQQLLESKLGVDQLFLNISEDAWIDDPFSAILTDFILLLFKVLAHPVDFAIILP